MGDVTRLRPVEAADVEAVAAFLSHPELVGRRGLHQDRPVARSASALAKVVEGIVAPEHGEAWVVEAGALVGVAFTVTWWDAVTPRVWVVIDPAHQRRGHGTEAARQILDHVFGDTPAMVVHAEVPSWDAAGLSFAESMGGERAGVHRRTGVRNGRYHDTVELVVLRSTWEERHAARR